MPWFYFARQGEKLLQVSPRKLPERPRDAHPSEGDPFTPWYETRDHFDSEHVHVFGEDLSEALQIAHRLLKGGF